MARRSDFCMCEKRGSQSLVLIDSPFSVHRRLTGRLNAENGYRYEQSNGSKICGVEINMRSREGFKKLEDFSIGVTELTVTKPQLPKVDIESGHGENSSPCDHERHDSHHSWCQRGWIVEVTALPLRSRPCWDETGISQRRHGMAWSIGAERVRKGSKDEAGELTRQSTWYHLTA